MGQQRTQVDPFFRDPFHRERKVPREIRVNTRVDDCVLTEESVPVDFDARSGRNAEGENNPRMPDQLAAQVELVVLMTDCFDNDIRESSACEI